MSDRSSDLPTVSPAPDLAKLATDGPAAHAEWIRRQTEAASLHRRLAGLSLSDALRGVLVPQLDDEGLCLGADTVHLDPQPRYILGRTVHDTYASFCEHVARFRSDRTAVFCKLGGDGCLIQARALYDYHTSEHPGWCQHDAILQLKPSPEFAAWRTVLDQPLLPAELADLIENNEADFLNPPAAKLLEVALTLRATQNARVFQAHRLHNGDVQMEYSTQTEAVAGADESLTVPSEVTLRLPVVNGGNPSELRCYFRYALTSGKLTFRIVLPGVERLLLSEAERVAGELAKDTACPVFRGSLL